MPDTNCLVSAYVRIGIPSDQLPYTEDFDRLHNLYCTESSDWISEHELWRHLCRLRKKSELPPICRHR